MLCEGCIERGLTRKPLATIRVDRNVSGTIKEKPRRIQKSTKGSRATKNLAKAARVAAMKRLRDAFPELYRILYAEERARLGLTPVPLLSPKLDLDARDRALRAAGERFSIDGIYDALAEAGIEEP